MGGKAKRQPPAAQQPTGPGVYVTGESVLVREYAQNCLAKGYRVFCHAYDEKLNEAFADEKRVTVSSTVPRTTAVGIELTNLDVDAKREQLRRLDRALEPDRLILSSSVVVSATEQASWIEHPYRLIGFSALPTFSERRSVEVAPTVSSPVETMEIARRFFASLGMDLEIVQDRVGMVFPRLLCHAINEAAFAIQEAIASPSDVDRGATLGAGFPHGPLEWADRIGLPQVMAVLNALYRDMQEERYRACPLLRQFALGGHWWNPEPSPSEMT